LSSSSGLLPSFFLTSWTKTEEQLAWRGTNRWERCSGGKVAKAGWRKNKSGDDIELRWLWARTSPFKAAVGLQRSFDHLGIWCRQHGAQQGQPVRSRCRKYGRGKTWRGGVMASYGRGVMASYGRDTDDDGAQRPKELTVMERKTREAQRTTLYARDSNKEKLSKSFYRYWVYFLARF
jgi:hypothetical protein